MVMSVTSSEFCEASLGQVYRCKIGSDMATFTLAIRRVLATSVARLQGFDSPGNQVVLQGGKYARGKQSLML